MAVGAAWHWSDPQRPRPVMISKRAEASQRQGLPQPLPLDPSRKARSAMRSCRANRLYRLTQLG